MTQQHILLPTDFSDNSWNAVVYAMRLYAHVKCKFYIIHSIKLKASSMSTLSNSLLKIMAEKAYKELDELKKQIETSVYNSQHTVETILTDQDISDAINHTVKAKEINLVIMGTKGVTGTSEVVFGTNTIHVIKNLKSCPLLIIPDNFDFKIPFQIAFPTDYNRAYSLTEIDSLRQLACLYNSTIRIVHINVEDQLSADQDQNHLKLDTYLQDHNHSFHWMPDYTTLDQSIVDFIDELHIDILVMVNYRHNWFEKLLRVPVIKKLSRHPKIPLLLIPERST